MFLTEYQTCCDSRQQHNTEISPLERSSGQQTDSTPTQRQYEQHLADDVIGRQVQPVGHVGQVAPLVAGLIEDAEQTMQRQGGQMVPDCGAAVASGIAFGGAVVAFVGNAVAFSGSTIAFGGVTVAFVGATIAFGGATVAFVGATIAFDGAAVAFGSAALAFGCATVALSGPAVAFGGAVVTFGGAAIAFGGAAVTPDIQVERADQQAGQQEIDGLMEPVLKNTHNLSKIVLKK